MSLSFTGIVYFPTSFAILFIVYRFYLSWRESGKHDSFVFFLTFLSLALVSFCGAFAGTIFAHDSFGIKIMLIVSSFLLSFANALFAYLFIYYSNKKISPYYGFWLVFILGIALSVVTIFSPVSPTLEKSGGIYWGLPLYLYFWRFLVYFLGSAPLAIVFFKKYRTEKDGYEKNKDLFFILVLFFILLVVFVDFIVEPLTGIHALISEVVLLILAVIGMVLYFYLSEKEVATKEKRFKKLVENMGDMIALIDEKGVIHYANSAHKKFLGHDSKNMINRPIYDFIHPEDHQFVKERLHFTNEDSIHDRFEFRMIHANGTIFWVETFGSFLLDKNSELERIVVASRDITDRKLARKQLEKNLREKEVLLKEIHHRVRNNLNIINSLLRLQSRNIKTASDVKEAFQESEKRVFSMALIHKKLYDTDNFSVVEMKSYIISLAKELLFSFGATKKIRLNVEVNNVSLNLDSAIPCGIILNELITNSIKYAFPNQSDAEISIDFNRNSTHFELVYRDNGVGMTEKIDFNTNDSLSLKLIKMLVEQLNGSIDYFTQNGTTFVIKFPITDELDRF
ncbi:MAG: hypothetical protein B6D62_02675 [Candidatus Cloacimonas sp. 4484_275]|nr:MAG: hypothetical protein B6D62_02675 [Candidatus Cloacimonas sp. 4484_275]